LGRHRFRSRVASSGTMVARSQFMNQLVPLSHLSSLLPPTIAGEPPPPASRLRSAITLFGRPASRRT
jgi:hypothetical protein